MNSTQSRNKACLMLYVIHIMGQIYQTGLQKYILYYPASLPCVFSDQSEFANLCPNIWYQLRFSLISQTLT